jgi:hypothetical protein
MKERLSAQNDDGSDKYELDNLRNGVGETNNVAAQNPEVVGELNQLIPAF